MVLNTVSVLCLFVLVGTSWSVPVEIEEPATRIGSHNLILCKDINNNIDEKIYSQKLIYDLQLFQTRRETLYWPLNGLSGKIISCIKILDQIPNNNGGTVEIIDGGVGYSYVEVLFTSKWSRGMNFNVELFGQ